MLDRFYNGTPVRQMWLIVAAVSVIALALGAAWVMFFRPTYQTLLSDLRPADASAIVAELDRKKVPYRLADGGATILVPSELVDGARLDVMGGDEPSRGTVGFELFNKSDMGLTDFAQKINYQRALQGELARTIMTFAGVDSVRVHLSLGEEHVFREDQVAPKASVTVHMKRNAALTQAIAQGIRRMVAAAVPRMDVADVVVLDEYGQAVTSAASIVEAPPVVAPVHPAMRRDPFPVLPPVEDERTLAPAWLLIGGPILFAVLAGMMLVRRLRGPRRLSRQQQQDFATRLRVALNEGGTNAASRL